MNLCEEMNLLKEQNKTIEKRLKEIKLILMGMLGGSHAKNIFGHVVTLNISNGNEGIPAEKIRELLHDAELGPKLIPHIVIMGIKESLKAVKIPEGN
jgi:hypothetical protein